MTGAKVPDALELVFLENARPDATLTYSLQAHVRRRRNVRRERSAPRTTTRQGNCNSTSVVIANVKPTATISTGSTTVVNGVPTFIAHAGQPLTFSGNSKDPGSDDLTLTWNSADGTPNTSTPYLVNPPNSPIRIRARAIQPRDVTDAQLARLLGARASTTITLSSLDDDAGCGEPDTVEGDHRRQRRRATAPSATGTRQYGRKPTDFTDARLNCYLQIVPFMSLVFNEKTDASHASQASRRPSLQYRLGA